MARTRILVVDDSVVARKIITEALAGEADLELAGTAPDGRLALGKIPLLRPDLILSDVEMPGMDGLTLVREVKARHPEIPIILFSGTSAESARTTLDALRLGAADFVTKPAAMGSLATAMAAVKAELLPRIRALVRLRDLSAGRPAVRPMQPAAPTPPSRPALRVPPAGIRRVDAVVLGISTGGPNALMEVIPRLPRSLPVPLLIVQHMPPTFTRLLAERLTASGPLPVSEAVAGDVITPGRAWIAPGDFHMTVRRRDNDLAIALDQNPPENSCRPAVDPLFRSAGQAWGGKVLAVIMTGMGQDGLLGCQALAPLGAQIIAQDEASSVVWGMPGAVARAGLPERLIPLAGMADEILRRVAEGRPGFRA